MSQINDLAGLDGLKICKMTGTGNDFIFVDNREAKISEKIMPLMAKGLCCRRRSVGADGLAILEPTGRVDPKHGKVDFKWYFWNADGSSAEMCGNASRCAARYANDIGLAGKTMVFDTIAGPIRAQVLGGGISKLEMTKPFGFESDINLEAAGRKLRLDFVNTGVPHALTEVDDIEHAPIVELGRAIRQHDYFQPAGTNANLYQVKDGIVYLRTYERGVEDETLACGTGVVAAALVIGGRGLLKPPITVQVRSRERLTVHFTPGKEGEFGEVFLEGPASYVYRGEIDLEAFDWLKTEA